MSLFGTPNIEKMKTKHDLKGLIQATNYSGSDSVRNDAIMALGELRCVEAVPTLLALLKSQDRKLLNSGLRETAGQALGVIGSPAVESLVDTVKTSDDMWTLLYAVKALGMIGDSRAVESLVRALKIPMYPVNSTKFDNGRLRKASQDALGKMGVPAIRPLLDVMLDNNTDKSCRWAAAEILEEIGTLAINNIIPILIPVLKGYTVGSSKKDEDTFNSSLCNKSIRRNWRFSSCGTT